MSLPNGEYIITNALHGNFACLPSNNREQHVVGITDPESRNHQWYLKTSPQGRYSIQNMEFGGFLWVTTDPQEKEEIIAMSGNRKMWWTIKMKSEGNYWICPAGNTNLSWNLPDLHDETPIHLQSANTDPRCLWKIVAVVSKISTTPDSNMMYWDQHNNLDRQALAAFVREAYEYAESLYKEALASVPRCPEYPKAISGTMLWLGQSIYKQGRYVDAEATFKEAEAIYPEDPDYFLILLHWRGRSIYNQARFADAEAIFKKVLADLQRLPYNQGEILSSTWYWLG